MLAIMVYSLRYSATQSSVSIESKPYALGQLLNERLLGSMYRAALGYPMPRLAIAVLVFALILQFNHRHTGGKTCVNPTPLRPWYPACVHDLSSLALAGDFSHPASLCAG